MRQIVGICKFEDAFRVTGRGDQFSHDGLVALFEYLEAYESDIGEEIELDVIALCCDFCEYGSALEAAGDYDFELEGEDDEEEALEWLWERTTVITFDGGVIIQAF